MGLLIRRFHIADLVMSLGENDVGNNILISADVIYYSSNRLVSGHHGNDLTDIICYHGQTVEEDPSDHHNIAYATSKIHSQTVFQYWTRCQKEVL
jgi:hypothetical protein